MFNSLLSFPEKIELDIRCESSPSVGGDGSVCSLANAIVKRFNETESSIVVHLSELRFHGPVNPFGSCRAGLFT